MIRAIKTGRATITMAVKAIGAAKTHEDKYKNKGKSQKQVKSLIQERGSPQEFGPICQIIKTIYPMCNFQTLTRPSKFNGSRP
jgi:hypothetical protein